MTYQPHQSEDVTMKPVSAKTPFKRCDTCEMGSTCVRDSRCWRPRTVDYWRKQVVIATEALNVAARNLNDANRQWKAAMDLEAKS